MNPRAAYAKMVGVSVLSLLLSPYAFPQAGQGNLVMSGFVRAEDGAPAAGVKVVGQLKDDKIERLAAQRETLTNAKGYWAIPFIRKGKWVVTAIAAEAMSEIQDVPLNNSRNDIMLVLTRSAAQILIEAKSSIYREVFSKASEILEWFLHYFPQSRERSAALFWMAYTHNRRVPDNDLSWSGTNLLEKAVGCLDSLTSEFPASEWREDAEILRIDTALRLYRRGERRYADVIKTGVSIQDSARMNIRLAALEALLVVDRKLAVQELRAIVLHGPDSKIREKAVLILGQSGGKEALAVLEEAAAKDPDTAVKKAAQMWVGRRDSN